MDADTGFVFLEADPEYQAARAAYSPARGSHRTRRRSHFFLPRLNPWVSKMEGSHECKIKADGIMSEDCDNLKALVRAARNEGYYVHVGITSFVADKLVKRRLEHFDAPLYITAYGLDSITRLRNLPHYIDPTALP